MKKFLLAVAAMIAVASVGLVSGPASAYPAGNKFYISSSANAVDPGESVLVSAHKTYPGCVVSFSNYLGTKKVASATRTADEFGDTPDVSFAMAKLGIYSVRASYSCNGFSESASKSITSGRTTTATVTLTSALGTKIFTTTANLKWGTSTGVAGMSATATLKDPSGVKNNFALTDNGGGTYSATYTVRKLVPGNYNVTVTFKDNSPYFGTTATGSLFKSALVTLASNNKLSPKIK